MTVASLHNTFQAGDASLKEQGFIENGQDGKLGHLYKHPDGRECRLVGNWQGKYEVQILKQAA